MTAHDDTSTTSGLFDGRYRIIRRLGSGGMARVFLAEDVDLHRQVAIKVLSDRYSDDATFVERFAREARAAAGLSQQNIVAIYDRGRADGSYYIAMEFLDGDTLKDVIGREGPLPPRRAIEVTLQLLAALRFAHRRDVIHRDVKPHNVMVLRDGRVKVTDFGIARAGDSDMTEAGSIVGTAQYLSPEQARGQEVGPESDLYSVGVVLYEMLTGRVPFAGDSAVAVAMKHVQERPMPPRQVLPSIPPGLEQIVLRAMEKDPARRYQSADEMGIDLDRVRKGLDPASPPLPTALPADEDHHVGRTIVSSGGALPSASPRSSARPAARADRARPAWPWIVALVLVAAVAAGAAYVLNGSGGGATPTTQPTGSTATSGVPNVVGMQIADAQAALGLKGFTNLLAPIEAFSDRPVGEVLQQDPPGTSLAASDAPIQLTVSKGAELVDLPTVAGKTYEIASGLLRTAGFLPRRVDKADPTIATGDVISQDPSTPQAAKGSEVVLTVSSGPGKVAVPNVVNTKEGDALSALADLGLVAVLPSLQVPSASIAAGTVISVSPAPGKQVARGTKVTLTVSSGPAQITVPTLVGLSEGDATAALKKLGLGVKVKPVVITDVSQDGSVISSDPPSDTPVGPGSTVTITVGHVA